MTEPATPPGRANRSAFGLARVRGDSMLPLLRDGDRLLVRYGAARRVRAVVLARFPDGSLVVKRLAAQRTARDGGPAWWLLSDNPAAGVDSRHRGAFRDADVVAVVWARLWPFPRPL